MTPEQALAVGEDGVPALTGAAVVVAGRSGTVDRVSSATGEVFVWFGATSPNDPTMRVVESFHFTEVELAAG